MSELPTGTVTFLFTDVEGSTRMLHELGDAYHELQTRHLEILVDASTAAGGRVVRTEGDAVFAVFTTPAAAVRAAVAGQRTLAAEPWSDGHAIRVRMGMHTGEGTLAELNRQLSEKIAAGEIGEATPGLMEHLWETTLAKMAVDQPSYASYRREVELRTGSKEG